MASDFGTHSKTVAHMLTLIDALHREEDGEEVDWAELGALSPYCGCLDCDIREILTFGVNDLIERGDIVVTEKGKEAAP